MTTTHEHNDFNPTTEHAGAFDQDAYESRGTTQEGDLSAFDDDYADAEAPEFDEVPDGKHQVRVHSRC